MHLADGALQFLCQPGTVGQSATVFPPWTRWVQRRHLEKPGMSNSLDSRDSLRCLHCEHWLDEIFARIGKFCSSLKMTSWTGLEQQLVTFFRCYRSKMADIPPQEDEARHHLTIYPQGNQSDYPELFLAPKTWAHPARGNTWHLRHVGVGKRTQSRIAWLLVVWIYYQSPEPVWPVCCPVWHLGGQCVSCGDNEELQVPRKQREFQWSGSVKRYKT